MKIPKELFEIEESLIVKLEKAICNGEQLSCQDMLKIRDELIFRRYPITVESVYPPKKPEPITKSVVEDGGSLFWPWKNKK